MRHLEIWLQGDDPLPDVIKLPFAPIRDPKASSVWDWPKWESQPNMDMAHFCGSKKWLALTPRELVMSNEWWQLHFKGVAVDPDSECKFIDFDAGSHLWSRKHFRPKKHIDRWAAAVDWLKITFSDATKIKAIQDMFRNKIITHRDSTRLNLAHCVTAIARGCRSVDECLQWLVYWFEPEMRNFMKKAQACIPEKEATRKYFDDRVSAATAAVRLKIGEPDVLLQWPSHVCDEMRRVKKLLLGTEGFVRQPKQSKSEPLVSLKIDDPEEHLQALRRVQHPLQACPQHDNDLVDAIVFAQLESDVIEKERTRRYRILEQIAEVVRPFYTDLKDSNGDTVKARRPLTAERIGPFHNPLLMAVVSSFTNYKDVELAWDTFWGSKIVGLIETSHCMRPNDEKS